MNAERVPGGRHVGRSLRGSEPDVRPDRGGRGTAPADARVVEAAAHECAEHVAVTSHLRADVLGVSGDPAAMIVEAAHQYAVDVITVGANRHSWLGRLLTGSVCGDVLRELDVPVLVVK